MIVIVKKHRHFHTAQPPHNASIEIIIILSLRTKYQLWLLYQYLLHYHGMVRLVTRILTTDIFSLCQVKPLSVKCSQPSVFISFKVSGLRRSRAWTNQAALRVWRLERDTSWHLVCLHRLLNHTHSRSRV